VVSPDEPSTAVSPNEPSTAAAEMAEVLKSPGDTAAGAGAGAGTGRDRRTAGARDAAGPPGVSRGGRACRNVSVCVRGRGTTSRAPDRGRSRHAGPGGGAHPRRDS
jgi:hypothetical protein